MTKITQLEQFTEIASGHFGSGWAWLVKDKDGKLKVIGTHDAANPLTDGLTPILTCDVWGKYQFILFVRFQCFRMELKSSNFVNHLLDFNYFKIK